jgi:hypothetical protein
MPGKLVSINSQLLKVNKKGYTLNPACFRSIADYLLINQGSAQLPAQSLA